MPKALEEKLRKQVANKPWSQARKDAYVYGTMRRTGWKPSKKNYSKGAIAKARAKA